METLKLSFEKLLHWNPRWKISDHRNYVNHCEKKRNLYNGLSMSIEGSLVISFNTKCTKCFKFIIFLVWRIFVNRRGWVAWRGEKYTPNRMFERRHDGTIINWTSAFFTFSPKHSRMKEKRWTTGQWNQIWTSKSTYVESTKIKFDSTNVMYEK